MPRIPNGRWLAALAFVLTPAGASAQRAVSKADVVAEWTGALVLDNGTENLALVFRAADTTLAGTVFSNGQRFADMENPSLHGDTVHFQFQRLDFTGVVHGTSMAVALIMFNGSTRHLTLLKTSTAPDSAPSRKPPRTN